MYQLDNGVCSIVESVGAERINDIWGDEKAIYVVGENGDFFENAGTGWESLTSPSGTTGIYSLWGGTAIVMCSLSDGAVKAFDRGSRTWSEVSSDYSGAFTMWFDAFDQVCNGNGACEFNYPGTEYNAMHGNIAAGRHGRLSFFNGTDWESMQPDGYLSDIYGMATIDETLYAAGWFGKIHQYDPDNNVWETIETGCSGIYRDIWGSSEDNIYAVGTLQNICHYSVDENGIGTWRSVESGAQKSDKLQLHFNAIWGSDKNNIYVVGSNNTIIKYNGNEWEQISYNEEGTELTDVWGNSSDNIFVVGKKGLILHFDGSQWSEFSDIPTEKDLNSIWGNNENDVYAVGGESTILHFDGVEWKTVETGVRISTTFMSVWGVEDYIFLGGINGVVLIYDGVYWSLTDTGTILTFKHIWGLDANTVVATSGNGLDGASWRFVKMLNPVISDECHDIPIMSEEGQLTLPLIIYGEHIVSTVLNLVVEGDLLYFTIASVEMVNETRLDDNCQYPRVFNATVINAPEVTWPTKFGDE